jgi:hypothetical protein
MPTTAHLHISDVAATSAARAVVRSVGLQDRRRAHAGDRNSRRNQHGVTAWRKALYAAARRHEAALVTETIR